MVDEKLLDLARDMRENPESRESYLRYLCAASRIPKGPKASFRRMTEFEKRAALALSSCKFTPGTSAKRIARTIAAQALDSAWHEISDRQARVLWILVHAYRRQIGEKDLLDFASEFKALVEAPHGS